MNKELKKSLNLYKVLSLIEHATETLAHEVKESHQMSGNSETQTGEWHVNIPTQFVKLSRNTYSNTMNYKLHGPSVVCNTAEWLARYSDMHLKGSKNMTETEMDDKFKTVLKILSLIYDCDVYVCFYDKFLAVRLLQNIYVFTELEKVIVTKLRGYLWD